MRVREEASLRIRPPNVLADAVREGLGITMLAAR